MHISFFIKLWAVSSPLYKIFRGCFCTEPISEKTSFPTYPLGDSVDLWIVLPSAHHLETPGRKKDKEKKEEGGVEGLDVSESTVQTTDTGKTNSSSKSISYSDERGKERGGEGARGRGRGRGLEAPAWPNTLNICMLIVFLCLGRSSAATARLSRFLETVQMNFHQKVLHTS